MYGEDGENQVGENGANAEDGAQDAAEEGRSANASAAVVQAMPRPRSSHQRSATPTPLTNRRTHPRVNSDKPSFTEVMTMLLCQQQEDRLIQQEE
jgi:hypothetical protein